MKKAPDFSLPDQIGSIHTLSEHLGSWVVVYFYPKDDTPGCTIEACNFRDNIHLLTENGIVVFGISKDNVKSHLKFQEKFSLNFPLLSDPDKATIAAFGALGPKTFMGKLFMGVLRKTFLINPEGYIQHVYEGMKLETQAQDILRDVLSFKGQLPQQDVI